MISFLKLYLKQYCSLVISKQNILDSLKAFMKKDILYSSLYPIFLKSKGSFFNLSIIGHILLTTFFLSKRLISVQYFYKILLYYLYFH